MNCKTLLFFSALVIALNTSAQIGKGSIFLGGNIGFSSQKQSNEGQVSNNFQFSPTIGKFIQENLVVGFDLGYSSGKSESYSSFNKSRTASAGVFLRKYGTLGKGFYLFGEGRIGGHYQQSENFSNNFVDKGKGYGGSFTITPGVAYSVNNKIQLEVVLPSVFNVSYSHMKYPRVNNIEPYRVSNFNVGTGFSSFNSFSVGIRILLNKNKQIYDKLSGTEPS